MKQTLLHNLKFILIGIVIAAGISFVYADGWTLPSSAAPAGNVDVPLHTGPTQAKAGGLGVGTFAVAQNALFDQNTYLNGSIEGGTPSTLSSQAQVNIGGLDAGGTTHTIPVTVAGDVSATGVMTNPAVATQDSQNNLCADKTGKIILCTTSSPAVTGGSQLSINQVAVNQNGSTINELQAQITPIVSTQVQVVVSAYDQEPLSARAARGDSCALPTTATTIGTLYINALQSTSAGYLQYPANCAQDYQAIQVRIASYSPTSDPATGKPINN
jgi:hypothetical protein